MLDIFFIASNQVALQLAIGAIAEDVEGGAAQATHFGQHPEQRQHPRAERALFWASQRILAARKQWRREIEADLEIAIELIAHLLFESSVGEKSRHFILILVGE